MIVEISECKKLFVCDCTNPSFEELGVKDANHFSYFIDEAEEITAKEFLENCEIEESLLQNIKEYPNDFRFYKNGGIIFFTHSMIEHFYK